MDDLSAGGPGADIKKRDNLKDSVWISDHPEFWLPDQVRNCGILFLLPRFPFYADLRLPFQNAPGRKFVQISGLHSELVALSNSGQLYQWKWNESEPYRNSEVRKCLFAILHSTI